MKKFNSDCPECGYEKAFRRGIEECPECGFMKGDEPHDEEGTLNMMFPNDEDEDEIPGFDMDKFFGLD